MANTLSKWIEKKFSLSLTKGDQEPPLPTLPRDRPRVLTPSPSRETLVFSAADATSNSAFFQKLPFEIRYRILKEAFGNYTVHMHLCYDFPKVPLDVRQRGPIHRHASYRKAQPQSQTKFGIPRKKTWQWWSCICHRAYQSQLSYWQPSVNPKPCIDRCYSGNIGLSCECWAGKAPGKCFIGVMGWLLSCRQSYAEDIIVLYSTNIIHMASSVMMRHLPQLLLPQRLSSIKSLEIVWHSYPARYPYRADQPTSLDFFGWPAFCSFIDVLESTMPRLRRLSITLDWDLTLDEKRDDTQDENKPTISTPVDDMVRRIRPRLDECDISIPYHFFDGRKARAQWMSLAWDDERRYEEDRYWRELPCTGIEDEALPMKLRGYWVCNGYRDYNAFPVPLLM